MWVTEEPPDRSLGGGSIRQAYLFESLARVFQVDLLLAGSLHEADIRQLAGGVTELPKRPALWYEDPVRRRLLELAVGLGSPYPLPAYMAGPGRRKLARALKQRHAGYDLICVEHGALAPVIRRSADARWIITLHHLLSGMIERELAMAPGRRQRWFRERELRKARKLEAGAVQAYDRSIVCSDEDAAALSSIAGNEAAASIAVVPNGVDLAKFEASPIPPEPVVLFPGTFHYAPNVDGAVWLCSEIWPVIRTAMPGAELMLVGRGPTEEIRRLGEIEGVVVHADVPSMAPYFAAARVVVVPLRVGTGTRLKALEGMASGRPVVGTTEGLAGLGIVDGVHALVRDDPGGFATAVIESLKRDDLAEALALAGRDHVETRFGWERIGSRFVETVSELLDAQRLAAVR